jgi:hypothetical protein
MRSGGRVLPFVLFALSASLLAQSNPALFAPTVKYDSGGYDTWSLAVGDLNRDGKPDLVVANRNDTTEGTVGVLLGNGDGTFQPVVTYASGGPGTFSVAIADVNSDGKPDVLIVNDHSGVGVLLGNGDGTVQTVVTYPSGLLTAFDMAAADVNADGKPDLIVVGFFLNVSDQLWVSAASVLLGNGNGTFQTPTIYPSGGYAPPGVAVADVNGDGKPDIVVANNGASSVNAGNGTVGVLLGKGDGTFGAASSYASGGYDAASIAVADLNGDGKPDLIVGNCCDDTLINGIVGVLFGIGNGTFQPVVPYRSGTYYVWSLAVADANLDGIPDIAASGGANSAYNKPGPGVLLGNGDGTFETAVIYPSGPSQSVAMADVNGDGKPDLISANSHCDYPCSSLNGSVNVLINTTPWAYKAFVQPTINADASSIFKANRGVIPVKFTLTQNNTATCQLPTATISVTRTAGGVIGSIDEGSYSMAADNGSNFRIDQTACQYVYNLRTSLGVGTYEVDIKINGVVGNAVFALK